MFDGRFTFPRLPGLYFGSFEMEHRRQLIPTQTQGIAQGSQAPRRRVRRQRRQEGAQGGEKRCLHVQYYYWTKG